MANKTSPSPTHSISCLHGIEETAAAAHKNASPMLERMSSGRNICRADVQETFIRLHKQQKNPRTASNFQGIEKVFPLAHITCEACTFLPSHPSPYCCGPFLMGDTAHCETFNIQGFAVQVNKNTARLRTHKKSPTFHCSQLWKTGSLHHTFVSKLLPTQLSGFSCAPPTTLVSLWLNSHIVVQDFGHNKLHHLSWRLP